MFVFHYFIVQTGNQFFATFLADKQVVPLCHAASYEEFPFNKVNIRTCLGEFNSSTHTGNSCAYYGNSVCGFHFDRIQ